MRHRLAVMVLVFGGIVIGSAATQENKDKPVESRGPAALVPAHAVAYIEVRQSGVFAQQLAAVVEGSCLENFPFGLDKLRSRPGQAALLTSDRGSMLGLLLTPEGLKEAQRFYGAALATFTSGTEGQLEYAAILQPGDSPLPGLLMRKFLGSAEVLPSGEFEGVKLYRQPAGGYGAREPWQWMIRMPQPQFAPPVGLGVRQEAEHAGTTFAMLPNHLVMGSTNGVKEVIRRARGKGVGPSLSDDASFLQASKDFGTRAGLMLHGDAANLHSQLEKLGAGEGQPIPAWAAAIKSLVNPRAVSTATGGLTIDKGHANVRVQVAINSKEDCRLLELLPTAPAKMELLHFVPSDAAATVVLSLPDASRRWSQLLDLADSVCRAGEPNAPLPSRLADRMEQELKLSIGKDLAGKITGLAVAVRSPLLTKRDDIDLLAVLELADEDAARNLTSEILPKLYSHGADKRVVPTVREVKGQAMHSLEFGGMPTLHYGRQGTIVVVGVEKDTVAEGLAAGGKKQGLAADARVVAAVKEMDNPVMLVIVRSVPALLLLERGFQVPEPFADRGLIGRQVLLPPGIPPPLLPVVPGAAPAPGVQGFQLPPPVPGQPAAPRDNGRAPADPPAENSRAKELIKLSESLDPLIIGVVRKTDRLIVEARQAASQPSVAKLIDVLVERTADSASPFGRYGGGGRGAAGASEFILPPEFRPGKPISAPSVEPPKEKEKD